ncbi:VWFA domain-containing protein [uncultured Gammaproteobacteria bacterium]
MTYSQEISRDRRGVFLFLVDQSRSMDKEFGKDDSGQAVNRATVVANALNCTLEELVNRCMRDEGVRDYFDIGIIGYGRTNRPEFCWRNGLANRKLVSISEVAENAEIEQREISTMVRGRAVTEQITVSRWIEPVAGESTPMNAAFRLAAGTLEEWIYSHPTSFPPVVINITDGMANDVSSEEELLASAQRMTALKTSDGATLLINCHISGGNDAPVVFPWSSMQLPRDPYAKLLFEMSSELSARHRAIICEIFDRDPSSTPSIRGMAFNADAVALVKLLDIGTRQAFTFATPPESGNRARPGNSANRL